MNSLYVNSFCQIHVTAFNDNGLIFSSINGTEIEWGYFQSDMGDRPFDFYKLSDTPIKGESLPPDYNIIRPKRVALTNLTCKLVKRDAKMANQPFQFVEPITFSPGSLYMLRGAEAFLHLYYAVVVDNEIVPDAGREVNLTTDFELFRIKANVPSIAEVTLGGRVDARSLGKTTVTARDKSMLSNIANANVNVVVPDDALWPEQWIKTGDQDTGDGAGGPFEPDASTIVLLFENNTLIVPDDLEVRISDNWRPAGTHSVTAEFPDVGFSHAGTVHTCPPPRVEPDYVRLPVGYNNYQFKILGGSGHFNFTYDDSMLLVDHEPHSAPEEQEDGRILSAHSLSPLREGEAVITIVDEKLPGYSTTLTIVTAKPMSIDLQVHSSELFVGEKFTNYSAYVYDKDHNLFDNIEAVDIIPEDARIVNASLIGSEPGFTRVHASIGDLHSDNKTLMVMERLKVNSPLNGNSMTTLNLGRTGGPLVWPSSGQSNVITCGDATFEFLDNFTHIKFLRDFKGECTMHVVNDASDENPNPRVVDVNFSVILERLWYVAVLPSDLDSNNVEECGLLMSSPPEDARTARVQQDSDFGSLVDRVRIPRGHRLELKLLAYGEENNKLGGYSEPDSSIVLVDSEGRETRYEDPIRVERSMNVTIRIKDDLPAIPLEVEVIQPHGTREPDPFSLYKKKLEGAEAHIVNGSGPFEVDGELVRLVGDRTLHIDPSFNPLRSVLITDRCIPENNITLHVKTFSIGRLDIEGPAQAVVGEKLEFTAHLITPDGETLPPEFYDQVTWSTPNGDLKYNNETGKWEITATEPGRLELILTADDSRRSHTVTVFEKIKPKHDYIRMFVGESQAIEFEGLDTDKIKINSSDPDTVSFDDGLIATAHKPGIITATAYFPDYPFFDNQNITIHVLEAKGLILECNKTNLRTGDPVYVGSYVHVIPHILTDIGPVPPKTISWTVDGSDNWMKIYDHSIVIQGDKEGTVVIDASSINGLSNKTEIYFDHRLALANGGHIKIPVGTTYQVRPSVDLENVTYTIAPTSCKDAVSGVTINETGHITAGAEGRYIVIVGYRNQWEAVPLTITTPSKLILESEAAQIVRPRLLDEDYQEYSASNGTDVKFVRSANATLEEAPSGENVTEVVPVNYDRHYTFDIPPEFIKPVLVESRVSIPSLWRQAHCALLFPRKNIYPQNPVVQKGAEIQFRCQAAKPNYNSLNTRVATISTSGLMKANKEGRTVVQCTPEIETTVTVVTFESVSLRKVKEHLYKVEGRFIPQGVADSNLIFASDITYRCKWDADECGYTQDVVENGEHYCKLRYYDRHLCPEHSTLTVNVESPKTQINLVGKTDVFLKNTYFLITPIVTVGVAPDQDSIEFDLKTAYQNSSYTDDISYELPPNVNLTWDESKSKVRLNFLKGFTGGNVTFEHNDPPYERVKLTLKPANSSWSSSYLKPMPQKWDNPILIVSIIITILMALYVLMSLGEGELLPPYSPYNVKGKGSLKRD